jgi:hypothetical protein
MMGKISDESMLYKDPQPVHRFPGWTYDEDDESFTEKPYEFYVRLYFAVKGIVQGYFRCYAYGPDKTLRFHSEDWVSVKPIKIKPSQGYRYFVYEEK